MFYIVDNEIIICCLNLQITSGIKNGETITPFAQLKTEEACTVRLTVHSREKHI